MMPLPQFSESELLELMDYLIPPEPGRITAKMSKAIRDGVAGTASIAKHQARRIDVLVREMGEMRLRVGCLIRLLADKGIITPAELASTVNEARANITHAREQRQVFKKLPKPPKGKLKKPTGQHLKRASPHAQEQKPS